MTKAEYNLKLKQLLFNMVGETIKNVSLLKNPDLKEKIKSSLIIRSVIGNNIPKDAIGNTSLHSFKESDFIKAKEYNSENIINVLKTEWFGK